MTFAVNLANPDSSAETSYARVEQLLQPTENVDTITYGLSAGYTLYYNVGTGRFQTRAPTTIAQTADSTTAGGNARGGISSTDWQQTRTAANMVASANYSTIGGGRSNTADGVDSTVCGGNNNRAFTTAFVGGGVSNNATGTTSVVGGGDTNAASSAGSVIAGGRNNFASGIDTWVPGGRYAHTRGIIGRGSWASGRFAADGDAQSTELVLRVTTTDATTTAMVTDASAAGTTNQLIMQNSSGVVVRLLIVAREMATSATGGWELSLMLKRQGTAAGTSAYSAPTNVAPTWGDGAPNTSWRVSASADTTNGGLSVTVTGEAAKTIRWVARVMAVEVQG